MAVALLGLPAKNPPFNLPDYSVARPAGRTLAEAHLEHPEEPDGCIKGVVPVREAASCASSPAWEYMMFGFSET
jgi:hypothetical protein